MKLDKIFGFLVPKDRKFFPLFNEAADNLVLASELLIKLIREADLNKRQDYMKAIKDAEHVGDDPVSYTHLDVYKRQVLHLTHG